MIYDFHNFFLGININYIPPLKTSDVKRTTFVGQTTTIVMYKYHCAQI